MKKIFIVAGEASGDMHGAALVRQLQRYNKDVQISGYGGKAMVEAGVNIFYPLANLAVIGFFEVIKNIFTIKKLLQQTKLYLQKNRPDVVVLIDYPGFNFKIGQIAREFDIPVVYYIAPQLWAWWPGRVKKMKEFVRKVLVIFSFEELFYKKEGIDVAWVGHPLVEKFFSAPDTIMKGTVGLDPRKRIIGLLPGSRKQEIAHLLPAMVSVVGHLATRFSDLQFVLIKSSTISENELKAYTEKSKVDITIVEDESYQVRKNLTFALVASGTATLETAYLGIPMVILYKVNPLTYFLGKRVVRIPNIGLANIVLGKKVASEYIQDAIVPETIAKEVGDYLRNEQKLQAMKEELVEVRKKLGTPGASERAAQEILKLA